MELDLLCRTHALPNEAEAEFAKTPRAEPVLMPQWQQAQAPPHVLPRLMLRKPGDTHRENDAMANILAAPREDSLESEDLEERRHTSLEPTPSCGASASSSMVPERTCARGVEEKRQVSDTVPKKLPLPLHKLRKPDETYREQMAMAKVMALPPDFSARSDVSTSRGDQTLMQVIARDEQLASAILEAWESDPGSVSLRGLAKSIYSQAQQEVQPNEVQSKAGAAIPKLQLRQPGETHREQAAMAKAAASAPQLSRRSSCSTAPSEGICVAANANEMIGLPHLRWEAHGACKKMTDHGRLAPCGEEGGPARPAHADMEHAAANVRGTGSQDGAAAHGHRSLPTPKTCIENRYVAQFWKDFPNEMEASMQDQISKRGNPAEDRGAAQSMKGKPEGTAQARNGIDEQCTIKVVKPDPPVRTTTPLDCASPLRARPRSR